MSTNLTNVAKIYSDKQNPASSSGTQRAGSNRRNPRDDDYVPAKFWLNFGIEVEVPNEDGEMQTIFIQLPKGIALDTMEPAEEKGTPEWIEQMRARNLLRQALVAEAEKLPANGGTSKVALVSQIRRVPDATSQAPVGESPLLTALMGKLAS